MKFFVVATLLAVASAVAAFVNTGASSVSRSDDGYGNYAFGYNEDHATGGTYRKEQGGPGYMSGSYGLRDHDGRVRIVNYIADALGYRASISTNEQGVDVKQDPAAVDLNYGNSYAVPIAVTAPVISKSYGYTPLVANYADRGYSAYGFSNKGYSTQYAYPSSYSVSAQHSYVPVVAGHDYNVHNVNY